MGYWGTTTRQALERLLERYPDTNISFAAYEYNGWRNWSILPTADRQRIQPTTVVSSDFYINFGREHLHTGQLWQPMGPIIASRQVYNNTIWSVEALTGPTADAVRADWLRTYQSITAAPPAARSYFDLYRDGNKLHYAKVPCVPADLTPAFFLHIYPVAPADLPAASRQYGFENRDFQFRRVGGNLHDGKCLTTVELPDYAIARIKTGQYIANQPRLWEVELPGGR